MGGGALDHVLFADKGRKSLLVVGNGGALVVGGASAVVREGVLGTVLAYALRCRGIWTLTTYRVTGVSTSSSALVLAKLRAGLELGAAPCLAGSGSDRVGIDGDSGVSALGGNEAREGRSGEDNGGVEHYDGDLIGVSSSAKCLRRNKQAVLGGRVVVLRWARQCLPGCLWRGSGVSMAEAQQGVADGSAVRVK